MRLTERLTHLDGLTRKVDEMDIPLSKAGNVPAGRISEITAERAFRSLSQKPLSTPTTAELIS
jgi:hypothetical protein